MQQVTVDALEKGFLVNVHALKSCPGLLVYIMETFEELGLTVVEARVSCADNFHLQAIGGEVRKLYDIHSCVIYLRVAMHTSSTT